MTAIYLLLFSSSIRANRRLQVLVCNSLWYVAAAESPARLLRRLQALLQPEALLVPLLFLPIRIAARINLSSKRSPGA